MRWCMTKSVGFFPQHQAILPRQLSVTIQLSFDIIYPEIVLAPTI